MEDVHAGLARGDPVAQRRVTPAEERTPMRFASDGVALAMSVCLMLATERPGQLWPEQVLPYALASMRLITPSGWTLTETSREVRLPAQEGFSCTDARSRGRRRRVAAFDRAPAALLLSPCHAPGRRP